ncbi:unnamed protein product [Ixodes pacificus]
MFRVYIYIYIHTISLLKKIKKTYAPIQPLNTIRENHTTYYMHFFLDEEHADPLYVWPWLSTILSLPDCK